MTAASFRDLNKNGRMDVYEDPTQPIEARVEDLLGQMTLAEKAGLMFQTMVGMDAGTGMIPWLPTAQQHMAERAMNHFNVIGSATAAEMAGWQNRVQEAAEATRLGIPVTISTDPRHAFTDNMAAAMSTTAFSQWPESLGLAATRDAALTQQFGDIARQEYRAVGIHLALHPMADLATEPRWARISGTFGEDAQLSGEMTAAYIRGFQGSELGPTSVACMLKHFPGGGPQKDGEDPHFPYGAEQVYPGDNFDYHLIPFEAAFKVGPAQMMPYYGKPMGIGLEEVGFGFSKQIVTDMLRGTYGFDGVVCTDWGLITDNDLGGAILVARAWGVEHLSRIERVKKVLDAGCDQFGGESCPELVIELVERGEVPETRLDESVRRLLRDKFRLGLFDNPFVDVARAEHIAGNSQFREAGNLAQRKSIVVLKTGGDANHPVLPLTGRPKLYLERVNPGIALEYGDVVDTPEEADFAIVRLSAPYEPRNANFLETLFHAGDLRFPPDELERILGVLRRVPSIVDIYLDRPAVIPEIAAASSALTVNFGASDAALLDILFGRFKAQGKLPFELPSSMEAVRAQKPDVPFDSANPLYRFGDGLSF